jgi:Cys-tRNA(Pro) deacylase
MRPSIARVVDALQAAGVDVEVREFAESTRTAEDAAAAIGTSVGQIVKSLVFLAGGSPILALVSGSNRADTTKLAEAAGAPVKRADADTVRQVTGFAIGGVPPIGHAGDLATYLDEDLMQYSEVWAAAGTPNSVFRITPEALQKATNARVMRLAQQG